MNIILENLLENDIIKCYNELDTLSKSLNNAYISHNEVLLLKEEMKLINLMKNIDKIANLREELLN